LVTRLATVDDVADRLGVAKDWVWAQARAGRIPHVQLGRDRRFREEALEKWLDELELQSVEHGGAGGPTFRRAG
jgi:excisionase family DNA binding protein